MRRRVVASRVPAISVPSSTSSRRIALRRSTCSKSEAFSSALAATWASPRISSRSSAKSRGYVVAQLDDADDAAASDQRHRGLALVAPFLEGVAALSGVRIGSSRLRGDGELAGLDGEPAAGVAAQRHRDALPVGVEAAAVVAHEGAQRVALDGVDVDDGAVRQLGEPLRDRVKDVVGAQEGAVLEAGLDDEGEVAVAALQPGDARRRCRGRRRAGRRRRAPRPRRSARPSASRRAELEDADEPVPEHDRREDDAGEAARREEPRASRRRPARRSGRDRRSPGGRRSQRPPRARTPPGATGGRRRPDSLRRPRRGRARRRRRRRDTGCRRRVARAPAASAGSRARETRRPIAGERMLSPAMRSSSWATRRASTPGVALASERQGRRGRGGLDERELVRGRGSAPGRRCRSRAARRPGRREGSAPRGRCALRFGRAGRGAVPDSSARGEVADR